jgi:hypothetical protein
VAKDTGAEEDVAAQVYWRMTRGRALMHLGDASEGERLMRSAVALARKTDFLNTHAEALSTLGVAVGDQRMVKRALRLYRQKGNVAAAARLRPVSAVY